MFTSSGKFTMPHKDPEARAAFHRGYYRRNREKYLARAKRQRAEPGHAEHIEPSKRRSHLMTRYGITDDQYHQRLARQGYKCLICNATTSGNGNSHYFDVDHDHVTGKIRGLLCRRCNVTAGVLENNVERIKSLTRYIQFHKDNPDAEYI